MPTSTTVSIVFELLGAAVAVALIKIGANDGSVSDLVNYINTEKATEIILGIVLSVIIAFSVGAFVQYISRLLLSFNFERKTKWAGAVFGGVALAAITYFIFIKGLKGTDYYENIGPLIEGKTFLIVVLNYKTIIKIYYSLCTSIFRGKKIRARRRSHKKCCRRNYLLYRCRGA